MGSQFVKSIEIDSISFAFDETTGEPLVGAGVKATFVNPYGFEIQVRSTFSCCFFGLYFSLWLLIGLKVDDVGMTVEMLNSKNVPYMGLSVPERPTKPCPGSLACVDFSRAVLRVDSSQEEYFKQTVMAVLTQKSAPLIVSANASVQAMTNMGQIEITGFPFKQQIQVGGMEGFKSSNITMQKIDKSQGVNDELSLTVSVYIENPSNISAKMGLFHFDVYYKRVAFGFGSMYNFSVAPGNNLLRLDVTLKQTKENYDLIAEFIFAYIKADSVLPIEMHGNQNSTNIPLLAPVLDNLELGFDFKPTPTDFIVSIDVTAEIEIGLPKVTAYCTIYNPMAGPIHLDYLDIDVLYEHKGELHRLYTLKQTFRGEQPRLEADTATDIKLDISLTGLNPNWDMLDELVDVLKGEIEVSVKGPVTVNILPSFRQNITYAADHVKANVTICGMPPFPACTKAAR